jgi:hypothetical protein
MILKHFSSALHGSSVKKRFMLKLEENEVSSLAVVAIREKNQPIFGTKGRENNND